MGNADKTNKEKKIVGLMIKIFCKKNHRAHKICVECQALIDYANAQVDACPKKETKTFCSNCTTHCYKEDMREQIRKVMKFSGPRMLFYHPIITIKHLISSKRKG